MKRVAKFFYSYRIEFSIVFLLFLTILIAVPVFTYIYFIQDLRSKDAIMNRNDTGVVLLDRNDKPFFTFYQAKQRKFVPLADIPPVVQEAVISSEDKDFFTHPGFSTRAIFRSLYEDILRRSPSFGGSTITQQLVKNALLNPSKNFLRKYQEIVLAQEIERRYSKKEILEMYLNSVYFGEGAFGIENASLTYFNKDAKDLTLSEAALLTGILPAPSQLSPISGDKNAALVKEKSVLGKMVSQGYITPTQEQQAENTQLVFESNKTESNTTAAHFALMVKDELVKEFGEERISRSGFKVKTTIDLDYQKYAEKVVDQQVQNLKYDNVSNGAAVAMDPKTGEVLALVGSHDWFDETNGKLNMAITPRSPGSSFKPIVYSAALEQHLITAATPLGDNPTTFPGGYKPLDYDKKFRGTVLVRRALANSLNIPAVEVMQHVGVDNTLSVAKRFGITTLGDDASQYGLSLVLGSGEVKLLELTDVYAMFANGGARIAPDLILTITDKDGQIVQDFKPSSEQVLDPGVAYIISSILSDNATRAEEFGNLLTISRPAAVKTGTAEDFKDALTLGYTPQLTVGVWVGNNDNAAMDTVAGSLGAAPIWRQMMEYYLSGKPIERFTIPEGIVETYICKDNGLRYPQDRVSTTSATLEYFLEGTTPTRYCINPGSLTPALSQTPSPTQSGSATPTPLPTGSPTDVQATPAPTSPIGPGQLKQLEKKLQ